MNTRLPVTAVAILGLAAIPAAAQERPVRWRVDAPATEARMVPGGELRVTLAATVDDGWKLYSLTPQQGGPIATTMTLGDSVFRIVKISAPEAEEYPDRNFNIFTRIYRDSTRVSLTVAASRSAKPGAHVLPVHVTFQTCTDRYCLPPRTDTLAVAVRVEAAEGIVAAAEDAAPAQDTALAYDTAGAQPVTPVSPVAPPPPLLEIVAPTDLASLARFIWLAVSMGLLALLTPCILPMIPITVAYFGGGTVERTRGRVLAALAHAAGIVVAFTALGFAVSAFLGAGDVVRLAANPWINLLIAAFFATFALNLLGVFEITLPQRVLVGASRLGTGGQRHAAGAILMGVAFAITSFTCTLPFVGTLLVLATQGSWRWPLVGLAAYGVAFALPFFLLALAPRLVDRLPRAGSWVTTLKWSLAVAELALAVKFVSNADLVLGTAILSREAVIALWAVAALAIAIICLEGTRGAPRRPRLISAAGTLAAVVFAVWLGHGLNGGRLGELEAYLPPARLPSDTSTIPGMNVVQSGADTELAWLLNDYDGALSRARAEHRPVLLDFTGYTCTNCRWMEANMFPRPDVAMRLERFVRVRLFTDGMGEPYATQQRLQQVRFGTVALPYYAVVDAQGTPIATFLGMTRDSKEFSRFLEQALNGRQSGGKP